MLNRLELGEMAISFWCCILLYSYLVLHVCAVTLDDSYNQMNDTLTGYDSRHRPVLNQSQPVQVNVTFEVLALQEFDEVNEKFSVVGLMYITWYDEKLVWNPFAYGGLWSQMYKTKDVWYPIMILSNPYVEVEDFIEDWMSVRVYPNGFAVFSPGSVFKSTCSVDVTYYPFDTQTCNLNFVAWGYGRDELYFTSSKDHVGTDYYSQNGIWDLSKTSAESYILNGVSFLDFKFTLKRKPLFLVINVLLPIVFMSIINILVFVLPPDSGERVSYSITVLLAIAVFLTLVGDNIPKTSKPMSVLCYFLMIQLILSTLMCVAAILNLRVYFKKTSDPIPSWCKYMAGILNCECKLNRHRGPEDRRSNSTQKLHKNDVQPFNTRFKGGRLSVAPVEEFDPGKVDMSKGIIVIKPKEETTWKEVSYAVDKICIALFLVTMAIVDGIYLSVLVNNENP